MLCLLCLGSMPKSVFQNSSPVHVARDHPPHLVNSSLSRTTQLKQDIPGPQDWKEAGDVVIQDEHSPGKHKSHLQIRPSAN